MYTYMYNIHCIFIVAETGNNLIQTKHQVGSGQLVKGWELGLIGACQVFPPYVQQCLGFKIKLKKANLYISSTSRDPQVALQIDSYLIDQYQFLKNKHPTQQATLVSLFFL